MVPRMAKEPPRDRGPEIDAKRGLELIQKDIDAAEALIKSPSGVSDDEYQSWYTPTLGHIKRALGTDHDLVSRFRGAVSMTVLNMRGPPPESQQRNERRERISKQLVPLRVVKQTLMEALEEESESGANDPIQAVSTPKTGAQLGREVFVVHGRDEATKGAVARALEKLNLKPLILHEQANLGKTLIEKFEHYAAKVGFAVVILSGDDLGRLKTEGIDDEKLRSRQNVVLELGFFFHALGRKNVCALYEHGVERPSDTDGIVYVELDSGGAWQFKLVKELQAAGYPVSADNLLR